MEQIRSGQSFLYRENGYSSTVIEVNMKEKIRGDYLQVAYQKALKRFPYLSKKIVEKDAKYYLCDDVISLTVNKTNKFRTLGSMQTGYHLIDLTYIDKSIRVAFHHGLCDGGGIKPFVETLIYYYCFLKYKKQFGTIGLNLENEEIDSKEYEEPFGIELFDVNRENVFTICDEKYSIPENTLDRENTYRTEIIVNQDEFIKCCKENNATPSILASIIFSRGIYDLNESDKTIVSNIAIDLRKYIGKELTHKNCTGTVYLPYKKEDENKSIKELSIEYRELLNKQRSEDSIKYNLNRQIQMFNKLDEITDLNKKREMLSFLNTLSNDTYVISYLGQMNFNDFNEYIDYTCFYSERNRGVIINIVASSNNLCFEILQNFEDEKYINKFAKKLEELDISYRVNRIGKFKTGKDKGYITASRQAERYYKKC